MKKFRFNIVSMIAGCVLLSCSLFCMAGVNNPGVTFAEVTDLLVDYMKYNGWDQAADANGNILTNVNLRADTAWVETTATTGKEAVNYETCTNLIETLVISVDWGNVPTNILPASDGVFTLGSPSKRFLKGYISSVATSQFEIANYQMVTEADTAVTNWVILQGYAVSNDIAYLNVNNDFSNGDTSTNTFHHIIVGGRLITGSDTNPITLLGVVTTGVWNASNIFVYGGIDSPLQTETDNGASQYGVHVKEEGIASPEYYLLGKLDETSVNGHVRVDGIIGGRDESHGRASVGLTIAAENNFDVIGYAFGAFVNSDLVVYLDSGEYYVYLKAGAFAEANLDLKTVGGGSSLEFDGTSTLSPGGSLYYTLSTDPAAIIRMNLDGDVAIGTNVFTSKLTVNGDITATTFLGELNGTVSSGTTGTTQSPGDNSDKLATCGYADNAAGSSNHWAVGGGILAPKVDTNLVVLSAGLSVTGAVAATEGYSIGGHLILDHNAVSHSTVVGYGAGGSLTDTALDNYGFGRDALGNTTLGDQNIGIGYVSLNSNITGDGNVGIGSLTLFGCTNTDHSTGVGYETLRYSTGRRNTGYGAFAGLGITTGEGNTAIGYGAEVADGTANNQLSIANLIYGNSIGGISIGTNVAHSSAILHLASTNQGFVPPHLTDAQWNAIVSPTNGVMAYDSDDDKLIVRIPGSWKSLVMGAANTFEPGYIVYSVDGHEIDDTQIAYDGTNTTFPGNVTVDGTLYGGSVDGYVKNGESGFAERHISTGVFSTNTVSLTATGTIYSVQWGREGTRAYVTTDEAHIYQYNLTVPYDISTATIVATNSFTDPNNTGAYTLWNDDGTMFWHGGRGSRTITLSNAWDITSIVSDVGFAPSFRNPFWFWDLRWVSHGTKLWGVGYFLDDLVPAAQGFLEWECTTPYDFRTKTTQDANVYEFPTGVPDTVWLVRGFDVSPDERTVYLSATNGIEYEVVLEQAGDLSSTTLVDTRTRSQHTHIVNYAMVPDGSGVASITPAGLIVQKKFGLDVGGMLRADSLDVVNDANIGGSLEVGGTGDFGGTITTDGDLNVLGGAIQLESIGNTVINSYSTRTSPGILGQFQFEADSAAVAYIRGNLTDYANAYGEVTIRTKDTDGAWDRLVVGKTNEFFGTLGIDSDSNAECLRIYGADRANELADQYIDSLGTFNIDMRNSSDALAAINLRPNDDQYGVMIKDGSGGSGDFANLYMTTNPTVDYLNIVINASEAVKGLVIDQNEAVGVNVVPSDGYKFDANGSARIDGDMSIYGSLVLTNPPLGYNSITFDSDRTGVGAVGHTEFSDEATRLVSLRGFMTDYAGKYGEYQIYTRGSDGLKERAVFDESGLQVDGVITQETYQVLDSRDDLGSLTGWLTGGHVTANATNSSLIDITAGTGQIIDYTDPTARIKYDISWGAFNAITSGFTGRSTWIVIQDSGDHETGVVNYIVDPDPEDLRDSIVLTRLLSNVGGPVVSTSLNGLKRPAFGVAQAVQDYLLARGSWFKTGCEFTANDSNLLVDSAAGVSFRPWASTNKGAEHLHIESELIAITNYNYHLQGSNTTTLRTELDVNYWDNNGVRTAVPDGQYQIQLLIRFPVSATIHVVPGQAVYASLKDAVIGYDTEEKVLNEEILDGSIPRTHVIVRQGTTNLQQAIFIQEPLATSTSAGQGRLPQFDTKSYGFSDMGLDDIFYVAGMYEGPSASTTLTIGGTESFTLGTAGKLQGSHVVVVSGGNTNGTNLVVTVTGTSATDDGVVTTNDSEIVIANANNTTIHDMYETTNKWNGQVTVTLSGTSGSISLNNCFAKYDDWGNIDFRVLGFEVTGKANANASDTNFELLHHSSEDWTYHATDFVPGGTVICSSLTDDPTNAGLVTGDYFAYKRANLSTDVEGTVSGGVVARCTQTTGNAFKSGIVHIDVSF